MLYFFYFLLDFIYLFLIIYYHYYQLVKDLVCLLIYHVNNHILFDLLFLGKNLILYNDKLMSPLILLAKILLLLFKNYF